MNIKQSVLNLLYTTQAGPLTRSEIRNQLADLEADAKQINNAIDNLRAQGMVENGETQYDQGKAVLTYKITAAGKRAIEVDAKPVETKASEDDTPVYPGTDIAEKSDDGCMTMFFLDDSDSVEKSLVELIECYRDRKQRDMHPILANPAKKLHILRMLLDSALVNPEFKNELHELAGYINKLEYGDMEAVA